MTTSNHQLPKPELRIHALAKRRGLSPALKESHSIEIEKRLANHLKNSVSGNYHLLAYRSLPEEVDTARLFATPDCQIYAPRVHGHSDMHWLAVTKNTIWTKGAFGILEPENGTDWLEDNTPEATPAILLCPLVGFDRRGNRLGMGKGCFDRWLEKFQYRITSIIGLAFSCQELPAIPTEPHDIPLHTIITEKEIISCQRP